MGGYLLKVSFFKRVYCSHLSLRSRGLTDPLFEKEGKGRFFPKDSPRGPTKKSSSIPLLPKGDANSARANPFYVDPFGQAWNQGDLGMTKTWFVEA
jgi:hypothetical protein